MSAGAAYDVIVVGTGSMGMSAGYHLASRGARTLLIDRFDPPHTEGSHHGEPRLIRHAYSGGEAYIKLALRADALWRELEEQSGEQLLYRSGVLNVADPDVYRYGGRIDDAVRHGIAAEKLTAEEIRYRWPGWTLPAWFEGMYEPNAGYLRSERCVAAYRHAALQAGAELVTGAEAIGIEAAPGGSVTVRTTKGRFHADRVIVSAGAWFSTFAPFIALPIRAVRKTVGWFQPLASDRRFDAGHFPGFTIGTRDGGYYGFPSIDGSGVKLGRHDGGADWKPGKPLAPFGSLREDEGDLRRVLTAHLPSAAGRLLRGAVCKYELTPDDGFIIDRHPAYRNVLLAGGFSGHGFKFASAVGEVLANLALTGSSSYDLEPFKISRFGVERSDYDEPA
ncbi:FAD dependent oxidoreductase [Paenibacillus curdlanolyticus YK9]|uniref:FAD dependent oxidoreductase n=1 Tax=Paenibacillus curdlanolyticus YK9 TaxID=717606 RepID=E0I7X8_9BACL|nr:N-methyl-L-tryptophan oxidase [Paenibacillus curdlanolyticus]EFM11283.1 FAD dependent oxidoreductase [Paenibacillus curdlanolyticus YK9]